jgi:hypothetical protein
MDKQQNVIKNPLQWWKIGLCALGVLMVAGAIIYSLMIRNGAATGASANTVTAPAAAANNAQTSTGIGELNWAKNISKKYTNSDFIFVILPGSTDSTKAADQTVAGTIEKIKGDGAVADVFTLSPQDPEFQITADRVKISKFPAILLLSATGYGAIINGDITETKLLQAYLTVQQACVPGNSGCCPK